MSNSATPAFDAQGMLRSAIASQPERLLTINEVAAWLGVSKAWVYDHATRKKPFLPCVRFGELTRFRRSEIERFIQEHVKTDGSAG
jgi:excisionase family DNA binding protein